MPEHLLESELFGHVRGAFTDAHTDRTGLLVAADGGTLFLDEVGDMPLGLQAKLLRVLEVRRVRPVGGDREVGFDVRIIAATHRDLEAAAEQGRFRADLLYRLDVIGVELPPLRERGGDVLLLAQRFLEELARRFDKPVQGFSNEALRRLAEYAWPGNVRELRNCVERAVALCTGDEIQADDLPRRLPRSSPSAPLLTPEVDDPRVLPTLAQVERRHIERVLTACKGSRKEAASVLGIDRKTLYRKLETYQLARNGT
jgi:DNA-binding NtrC family response regulator